MKDGKIYRHPACYVSPRGQEDSQMAGIIRRLTVIIVVLFFIISLTGCLICDRRAYIYDHPTSGTALIAMTMYIAVGSVVASGGFFNPVFQDVHYSIVESYTSSLSILVAGLLTIIDPVVAQVPIDVTNISATYDGGGKTGSLVVTEGVYSLAVTPTQTLVPEPGYQLVILDFPEGQDLIPDPGEDDIWYRINLTAEAASNRDIEFKAICTAKVQQNQETYYVPLMPAVTDFTNVPAITIPSTDSYETLTLPKSADMPETPAVQTWEFTDILFFPHIASNINWETEVSIINTSSTDSLTGTLKGYDNAGTLVETKAISLAANARVQYTVGSDFSTPSDIGYMILESDSPDMVGYMKFYVDATYRGAIPATSKVNSSQIYVSHIASNDTWWTGMSLLNTTDSPITITIEFSDGTTQQRTIAANAHDVFTIKSLFSGVAQPDIKSAVIKNAAGIVGLELFGSNSESADSYLSGVLLKDETAIELYFPHIAKFDTWWTGIVAYNPADTSANLTITPYQQDGTVLPSQALSVAAKTKYKGTCESLGFPSSAAWFHIASTQSLTGFELFGTDNGNQMGGYTCVNIKKTSGVFPKIDTGGWTGIALVNTQSAAASVTLTAYNDAGTVIATQTVSLNPFEKIRSTAPNLFSNDISAATYIGFTATRSIVGFQLNGSADNMLLDALPGI
jgi:hypothetical protein